MSEKPRSHPLFAGSAFVLFLGLIFVSNESFSQPQRLYERARARGTVRVIVSLREPFTPEGSLSSPAAQDQRRRISRTQDRILRRMAGHGATGQKRFHSIPFVGMEVDSVGLSALYSDPEVRGVEEDLPLPLLESASPWPKSPLGPSGAALDFPAPPLNLAASTALIQADLAWSRGYTG
ncbi:MAG: hypothetical protein ACRD21_22685, partial [Vicinamibacteria bacterium]